MQNRLFAVDNECMTGIVPTLESRHSRRAICEQVHNFSFAFVTPLGTDDNDIFTHGHSDR